MYWNYILDEGQKGALGFEKGVNLGYFEKWN